MSSGDGPESYKGSSSPDWVFVKTPHGFLRIVQLVVVVSGYISLKSGPHVTPCDKAAVHFSMYGCISIFSITIILVTIVAFFLRLDNFCPVVNLPLTVLLRDVLLTSLHLVVTILMFISSSTCSLWYGPHVAVMVFSAGSVWLFAATSYMNFRWLRQSLGQLRKTATSMAENGKTPNPESDGRNNPSFEQDIPGATPTGTEPPSVVNNMPDVISPSF